MSDPLDWQGKQLNWLNGQPYSESRNEWAKVWSLLPLYSNKSKLKELMSSFKEADVSILVSGTGSGKTVLAIPLMLRILDIASTTKKTRHNSTNDIKRRPVVAATMPKRTIVSAQAETAAKTLDVSIGSEVGYRHRNSDRGAGIDFHAYAPLEDGVDGMDGVHHSHVQGRLLFATDGLLLAQSMRDPSLSDYDAIIIDEAHERGVPSDMLTLAVLRAQASRRAGLTPLKFVVMSATIDPVPLKNYIESELGEGAIVRVISISGKPNHPIEQRFASVMPKDPNVAVQDAIATAAQLINTNKRNSGKIIVFVPTTRHASSGCDVFHVTCNKSKKKNQNDDSSSCNQATCVALYGKQNRDMQQRALDSGNNAIGSVGVIIATNVAESSLTIKNVKHVIDTGLQMNNHWMPLLHAAHLSIGMASKAQISQRMGRTGRNGPGVAHLMYTREQYDKLLEYPPPSIATTDITDHIFCMMFTDSASSLKQTEAVLMHLLTPPTQDQLIGATTLLKHTGLVDHGGTPTEFGRQCFKVMMMTHMDLWTALIVAHAAKHATEHAVLQILIDALQLACIMEEVGKGTTLWGSSSPMAKSRKPMGPDVRLVHAFGGDRTSDHEALLRVLKEVAIPAYGKKEGGDEHGDGARHQMQYLLARSAWTGIVDRAHELGRIVNRIFRIFSDPLLVGGNGNGRGNGRGIGNGNGSSLAHVILAARAYHVVDNGALFIGGKQVAGVSSRDIKYDSLFVPNTLAGNCCYESMVLNKDTTHRVSVITLRPSTQVASSTEPTWKQKQKQK